MKIIFQVDLHVLHIRILLYTFLPNKELISDNEMILEPRAWLINVLHGVPRNSCIKFRAQTSRITLNNIWLNEDSEVNFKFLKRLNLFLRTEYLCPHSSNHPYYRVNSVAINIFVQNEVWGTEEICSTLYSIRFPLVT